MSDFVEFFMGKDAAWHRLGTVKGRAFGREDIEHDAPEILMPITLQPMFIAIPETIDDMFQTYTRNRYVEVPKLAAAVREDGKVVGGGMGQDTYGLVQPLEAWEWGEEIAGLSGFPCISAGTIREGTQSFFTFDTGTVESPLGKLRGYLSILNSYDMSWQLQALNSNIIVVCANTAAMAQASAFDRIVLRHTKKINERMEQSLAAIRSNVDHTKETVAIMEKLAGIQVREFKPLLDAVFPIAEGVTGRGATIKQNAADMVREYMRSAVADGVKNSGLGFVQAVNTYENWSATIRGTKNRNVEDVRAERQIDALVKGSQPLTEAATKAVMALVYRRVGVAHVLPPPPTTKEHHGRPL
jgi:hypothetical protein